MSKNQTWNPQSYEKNARFVSDLGMPVVELLNPKSGERILDLGCGDGVLTRKLADLGCHVVGIDSSPQFIEAARTLGLEVYWMDAQAIQFDPQQIAPFDAVFSNAALHWMKRPRDVIKGVWNVLKPGGRFGGEFGGAGNIRAIKTCLFEAMQRRGIDPESISPWYYPGPEEYSDLLSEQGFSVHTMQHFSRPTPLPGDILGWLETFAQSFTNTLPAESRREFLEEIRAALKSDLMDENGKWTVDYVRLRFLAFKPG